MKKKQLSKKLLMVFAMSFLLVMVPGMLSAAPAQENAPPIRVAAVGDSITYGFDIADRFNDSYPAQLQRMLGSRYTVFNAGLNGVGWMSTTLPNYWDSAEFRAISMFEPDIILLMLGSNDSKERFWGLSDLTESMMEMIEHFRNLPSRPFIYIMTPAFAYGVNWSIIPDTIDNEIVPAIRAFAARESIPLIDIYTATMGMPQHFPDLIHPHAGGARVIAETVRNRLLQDAALWAR